MQLLVCEIKNSWDNDFKDVVVRNWFIDGKTKDECFRKVYDEVRHLRYCNDYRVQFVNKEIQKEFMEWRKTNVTIGMYYGGGVVD